MNLQQLAESDLAFTLENEGQSVTVTNPEGVSAQLKSIMNDIGLLIDVETGGAISGRNANVALRISTLRSAGFEIPKGIEESEKVPWVVEYTTVTGETIKTKVISSDPDRSLGIVTCGLELVL